MIFAGLDQLQNGLARTKELAIRHRFLKDNIDLAKLACFGSDGDKTFAGCKNGVVARLMRTLPLLVAFHCVLHRVPLGAKDSTNAVPYLQIQLFNLVEQLGRYYDDSPKRLALLVKWQRKLLGFVIKIVRSAFTRWLTHDKVTEHILISLIPIFNELKISRKTDATAAGLYMMLSTYEFIAFLLLSRKVLPIVATLSGSWQAAQTDFDCITTELATAQSVCLFAQSEKTITTFYHPFCDFCRNCRACLSETKMRSKSARS